MTQFALTDGRGRTTTHRRCPRGVARLESLETRTLFNGTSNATELAAPGTPASPPESVPVFLPVVLDVQFDDERAPHTVRVLFNKDVSNSLDGSDLILINRAGRIVFPTDQIDITWDAMTTTATFTFTGTEGGALAEGMWQATLRADGIFDESGTMLDGDDDGVAGGDFGFNFRFLRGDANRDGIVDLADFEILAGNFGKSGASFSQGDFNYDGIVNLADLQVLASRMGMRDTQTPIGVPAPASKALSSPDLTEDASANLV